MAVAVGRVRSCPLLHLRLVVLSHNTVRGAAGGALLCAELAVAGGFVADAGAGGAGGSGGFGRGEGGGAGQAAAG